MTIPVDIEYSGVSPSGELEAFVRERIAWLEQTSAGLTRVRVLLERLHAADPSRRHVCVRVDLTMEARAVSVVTELHEPPSEDVVQRVAGAAIEEAESAAWESAHSPKESGRPRQIFRSVKHLRPWDRE